MEPIFMELIPGGSKIPVSTSRVQEYVRFVLLLVCHTERERERGRGRDVSSLNNITMSVHRLYSMFMMVGCVQEELNTMKQCLNDIIPNDLLAGLNAEVGVSLWSYIIEWCSGSCMSESHLE